MPPFTRTVNASATENDDDDAEQVAGQRERLLAQAGQHEGDNLAHVAAGQVRRAAAHEQRHQEGGGHDRHDEQQFEGRFGDELEHDHFPVGGGDEGAALEQRLQCQGVESLRARVVHHQQRFCNYNTGFRPVRRRRTAPRWLAGRPARLYAPIRVAHEEVQPQADTPATETGGRRGPHAPRAAAGAVRRMLVRAAAGFLIAALTLLAGRVVEFARLGRSDRDAMTRVASEVRGGVDIIAAELRETARRAAVGPELLATAQSSPESARALFDRRAPRARDRARRTIGGHDLRLRRAPPSRGAGDHPTSLAIGCAARRRSSWRRVQSAHG